MKLSHVELIGQKNVAKEAESRQGPAKRILLACAVPAAFAFASLLAEGNAMAQAPNPEQGQPAAVQSSGPDAGTAPIQQPTAQPIVSPTALPASQQYTVQGTSAQISDANGTRNVYAVSSQRSLAPAVTVEGPCRLSIRFYPAVLSERFPTPETEFPRTVEYSLGPQGGTARPGSFSGNTRASQFTSSVFGSGGGLVLGAPIPQTIEVPAGRNVLTVTSPNGLLEVVGVERMPATPVARPVQPAVTAPVAPRPAETPDTSEDAMRPAFTFDAYRNPLHGLGTSENRGDIYAAEALGHIRLGDHLGLILGAMFSTYGLSLETPQAETSLRSYSGSIAAGLSYQNGGHYLYGFGFGGYRGITTSVLSVADGRTLDAMDHGYEIGAAGGYNFRYNSGTAFGLRVQGSNNPFNPLSARVLGAVPFTWAEGVFPYLEADVLWLHALRPTGTPGYVGLSALDEAAIHLRVIAGIPIYRIGPVVPIAIGGFDMNFAGGDMTSAAGIAGGGLRTFFTRGLELEAFGAASMHGSPVTADPLIMLRGNYRF